MATVRINSNMASYTVISPSGTSFHLINQSTQSPSAMTLSGSNTTAGLLIIYKGAPETFPSFSDRATRASDVLITFTLPSGTGSYTDVGLVSQQRRFIFGKHLAQQAAAASGIATWFLLCRSGTTSLTDKAAVIGTVGLVGSGSDLEVPTTNIISGDYYTSAGIYMNFPQNWTV